MARRTHGARGGRTERSPDRGSIWGNEKGVQRKLIKNATQIVNSSFEPGVDIDELVDSAERLIFEIATQREKHRSVHIKEIVRETIEVIDKLYQRKEHVTGIPTGFIEFDKMTSGLQNSDLIIVAGRAWSYKMIPDVNWKKP